MRGPRLCACTLCAVLLAACASADPRGDPVGPPGVSARPSATNATAQERLETAAALRTPSLRAAAQWIERARARPADRAAALRIARAVLERVTGKAPTRVTRELDPAAALGGTPFVIVGKGSATPAPTVTALGLFVETHAGGRFYSLDAPSVRELPSEASVVELPSGEVRALTLDTARERWRLTSEPDGKVLAEGAATTTVVDDVAGLFAAHRFIAEGGSFRATLDVFDLASGARRAQWKDAPLSVVASPVIAFDRLGTQVALSVEGKVAMATLASGRFETVALPATHPPSMAAVAFTEDGRTLCFEHLGVASRFRRERSRPPAHCAFEPVTAHHRDAVPLHPAPDGAWVTATGLADNHGMQHHTVGAAAFSRARGLGAVFEVEGGATRRYRLRVFDVATGQTVSTAPATEQPVDVELRFSRDGGVVRCDSLGLAGLAFDVATGKQVPFPEEHAACRQSPASTLCVVREPQPFCAFGELHAPPEVCP